MVRRILLIGSCMALLLLYACGQENGKRLASGENRVMPGNSITSGTTQHVSESSTVISTESTTVITTESTILTEMATTPSQQAEASETIQSTPTAAPVANEAPTPKPSDGIVVKSDNILSSAEKEALLAELEMELDNLFGAMNEAPEVQELLEAEEAVSE